jgi:RimJ/RimL family protein N-acetyltransferase
MERIVVGVDESPAAADPHTGTAVVGLRDGSTVTIRPLSPADGEALVRFHDGLSPESLYRRFLSSHPRISPAEVEHFTHLQHPDRVAYMAEEGGEIVGVGRYDRQGDGAEVAFAVADDHQGRGIATILLAALAGCATHHGIHTFFAEVLSENSAMLRVFRDAGYEVRGELEAGVLNVRFDLTALQVRN